MGWEMNQIIKICGLTRAEDIKAAQQADMMGFVSFPKSPRHLSFEALKSLLPIAGTTDAKRCILLVNPDDELLHRLADLPMEVVQLHGDESPQRLQAIRKIFPGRLIVKALPIATAEDLARASDYQQAADMLILDAKPPKDADRPGGNAISFDWTLIKDWVPPVPYLLAGGLRPDNVAQAIHTCRFASGIDCASGVEKQPGEKDPLLVEQFIQNARAAWNSKDV